ncbi:hypothetical protein THMIRHAS_13850 [Thiosulfatimonas sediminis]|uniref:DUF3010 domain-containing protein n=1 Tax=Thiosulfatimonas sediminis TaxID=2675054 RepID=A0A6F8PV41_9GAMM|nr:DUF3010 family protein [Thiosulfatimonas sediminis]BBP46012.1 hypothetical protein THMIRHAS_13850 [Thiosulfatimonas sediminis]
MRVLGVEIASKDINIALLETQNGMFYLPECRARKLTCHNVDKSSDLQYFQKSVAKLIEDYKIDQIVIRERMRKGKFAGSAEGFKLEAVLQLIHQCEVVLMNSATQSAIAKKFPMTIPFAETGLKKFQQQAFEVAYAQLSDPTGRVEQARQYEIAKRKERREERREEETDED